MTKSDSKKNLSQILKFASVGVLNTALDYALFALFFSLLGLDKNISQVFATAIAMTNSYIINRYFTFEKKGAVKIDEMLKFIIVNLVSMGVTIALLNIFYDVLHIETWANAILFAFGSEFVLSGDKAVLFCKLAAVPFSLAVNFLGNRLWVFKAVKKCSSSKEG